MRDLTYKLENGRLEQFLVDFDLNISQAYDLIPVMVGVSHQDAQCIFLNKKWYEYTGLAPETSLGDGWLKTLHPDDMEPYLSSYKNAWETGTPLNFEARLRDTSGNYIWHRNTGEPQYEGSGNLTAYISSWVDIHQSKESEETVFRGRDYYKVYSEAMPAMAFISDEAGNIIYYNKRWCEFTGISDGTEGWGWVERAIHHPDDLQKTLDLWNHSLNTGEPYEIEYRLRRYDGEYIWHLGKALPIHNGKGVIELWLGTNTDIHSLKQNQESLRRELEERHVVEVQLHNERELLQKIFDNIPVMLAIWDPKLNVTHLNNAIEKVTGWTKDDCAERGIMELAYPDAAYREWVSEYMESLASGFTDIKMATKDGGCKDTSWANIRISDGRNVGIGIDISERKAFEKKLSKMSRQLNTVVENITDGVVVYSPDGEVLSINKAAKTIMGRLFNDNLSGYDLDVLMMYDSHGVFIEKENWPRFRLLGGESFDKEEFRTFNKSTHKEAYLECSGIPIIENDKLVLAIMTFKDVTERKKAHLDILESNSNLLNKNEQLEKINQLHENLLYIIAHDLRNPIGNMYLMFNMLKDERNVEERANLLELLKEMVKRQENIVLGLVELLQVQSAEKILPSEIFLNDVMEDILAENDAFLVDCGAEVNIDFSAAPALKHIPSFVESIMRNLVNNSIKYRNMDEKLVLNITSMNKGEYLLVVVEDNGIGIDLVKHNNHLFQPFKRYTRQSEGTGMGLYLIRNLIRKNGGCIDLESTLGAGTKVMCYFREYRV